MLLSPDLHTALCVCVCVCVCVWSGIWNSFYCTRKSFVSCKVGPMQSKVIVVIIMVPEIIPPQILSFLL